MKKPHFPINIIPRANSQGQTYYQVRFYEGAGKLLSAKSYSDCRSWTGAYFKAKEDIFEGKIPLVSMESLKKTRRILFQKELMIIGSPPVKNDTDFLAVLLGALCGLTMKEVIALEYSNVDFDSQCLKIADAGSSRFVPLPKKVMTVMNSVKESRLSECYVIPNRADREKPCNPITIYRGLEKVLAYVHKFPSYDVNYVKCQTHFSWLRYTYINLLQYISIPVDVIDILCGYKKRDTGNADTEARALCEEVRQRIDNYTENIEILKDYPYQFF